ncbi:hypothetical protein MAR_008428 [Mya arenaria]|uniref:Ephrin RBD domain-containing protein n=1 Tax=Mya arenaria TaxID=6604 RepID=A0ABY7DYX6_MYAAR|nr:hypothetical protein MAR_008428 [Mya arenaria]
MGFNPARHFLSVPLHDRDLSPLWVRGSCLPQMGKQNRFLFDTSQLPPCMFQEGFQVFGIHVYLRRHETLVCPRENPQRYPPSDKAHGNIRHSAPASQQTHDINNNEKIDIRGNYDGVNISRDEQFNSVDIRDKANRKPSSSNDCPVARDSSLILLTSVILLFMSVVR